MIVVTVLLLVEKPAPFSSLYCHLDEKLSSLKTEGIKQCLGGLKCSQYKEKQLKG